jgi:outer membrane protein TolC
LAQKAKLSKYQSEIETVKAGSLPSVDFMASYGGGTDFEEGNDNFQVTLVLNYDLYDGGSKNKQENLAISKHSIEKAKLAELVFDLEQETMETFYRFQVLTAQLGLLEKQQLQLEEKIKVERTQLSHGLISRPEFEGSSADLNKNLLSQYFVKYDLLREEQKFQLTLQFNALENAQYADKNLQ